MGVGQYCRPPRQTLCTAQGCYNKDKEVSVVKIKRRDTKIASVFLVVSLSGVD